MRLWPVNAIKLSVLSCLHLTSVALHFVCDYLLSIKARLWLALWPDKHADDFVIDRKTVDMGKTGRTVVWASARVPISALRAGIRDGKDVRICRIEDTPHYRWISCLVKGEDSASASAAYRDYIRTYEPNVDADEQAQNVRQLVKAVSNTIAHDPQQVALVVSCPEFAIRGEIFFYIMDGVHRASIATACGVKKICVQFIEPQ